MKIGLACPSPSQYDPLDMVIRGIRQVSQRPVKQSLPVTLVILRKLLLTKPSDPLNAAQVQTIILYNAIALFGSKNTGIYFRYIGGFSQAVPCSF